MRRLSLLALAVLATGCPHGRNPNDNGEGDGHEITPPDITRRLQIAMVTPSVVLPETAVDLTIRGAGFAEGAMAEIPGNLRMRTDYVDENTLIAHLAGLPPGTWDIGVMNPDGAKTTLAGGLTVRAGGASGSGAGGIYELNGPCAKVSVYFGLDQAALDASAKSTLQSKLSCWNTNQVPLRLTGHADERGTTDYNLALGQRRADTVAGWLATNGVPASRLRTVSQGEESPADPGHDEAAWAKNRRVEVTP